MNQLQFYMNRKQAEMILANTDLDTILNTFDFSGLGSTELIEAIERHYMCCPWPVNVLRYDEIDELCP